MDSKPKYIEFEQPSGQKIKLYTEAFGSPSNAMVILNAGAGQQCISWPEGFCQGLAKEFYVIRYDYRDCGLSTEIDDVRFPYDLSDLADDVLQILQGYGRTQAHLFGFSMGGAVAQLLAAHHADSVLSLLLIGTSTNFKVGFDAFAGIANAEALSAPQPEYIAWVTRATDPNPSSNQKIEDYVELHRWLDGRSLEFELAFFIEQAKVAATRTSLQSAYDKHAKAMKKSHHDHYYAADEIKVPTLIIQGKHDPVFGLDHGKELNDRIQFSHLVVLPTLAHVISPNKFTLLFAEIIPFLQQHDCAVKSDAAATVKPF